MAERLTFILDGHDRLTPAFRHAGESAEDFRRRVNQVVTASGGDLRAFTQDADGRLRTLDGRFVSTGDSARRLQGDMNGLQAPMRRAATATGEASSAGGSLTPILYGLGAVLGVSVLPALGALVPMMAGAGLAMGTLKLGFAGVGDAVTAAGEDKKKYAAALKKLSPEARKFTKELVSLKKEFSSIGKDIQKAMLPAFTRALKDAKPVIDIVGRGMVKLGKGFGEAAAGVGKLFKSGGFQRDLKTNLDLGMQFVRGLSGGFGTLVQSLLSFGAKSAPTLKSFTSGLSGLLGKALPGMFKGLETGIGGSAKFLDGLFSMINRVLPAIGRFSGELARSLGPLFGEMFKSAGVQTEAAFDSLGKVLKGLTPVFKDLGFGIRAVRDLMGIFVPTIEDVGSAIIGSLLPSFSRVDEARGPLQRLSDTIKENRGSIQEMSRIMGGAFLDVVSVAIDNLPRLLGVVRLTTGGMVNAFGGVLHAAASSFGWLPGIGDKLRSADRAFGQFKDSYMSGLASAEQKTRDFADGALPKLEQGKLKLNINNWQSQIETAKAKLKTLPPEKQAKLKGEISDLQAKIRQAKIDLAGLQSKTVSVMVQYRTSKNPSSFAASIGGYASGGKPKPGELAWVGEEGPELMRFGAGGAEIYSHNDSMAMVSDAAKAGRDASLGLQSGMSVSTGAVKAGGHGLGAAVLSGIRDELQIASPSKRTKALAADAGKGMLIGLTGSKAKISEVAKDLVKDIWAAWQGTKSTKDSKLVAMVNRDTAKLQKLASARDALIAKIAAAKKYASDITSAARQESSLGQLGIEDGKVTAGSIQAGLQQKLAKLKTFTSYIGILAKKGLSKTLLRQILDMGPEQGYAYASALAGASSSTLKSINATQSALDKATTTLGRNGADILYDSGKQAGKGFLSGLESQQDAIEAQMIKIAKGMQKAIRKALGISSPAKKLVPDGINATRGVAVGLVQGIPYLDRALGAVTDRVASAQPVIGRPAVMGASGGNSITVNVDARGAMDPVAVGREVEKIVVRFGRSQGLAVGVNR